ncbi:MAG: SGNH/GDSL hydrolase family protein [Fibrobacteres bacterium]|nr:SGNH/GDSL hydrolase family protein [Fibrobacterota bacterium]
MRRIMALGIALLALCSCDKETGSASVTAFVPDPGLAADLAKTSALRVFFGHQSVGGNIVDGLEELRSQAGDTAFRVIHGTGDSALPPAFFAEAKVGRNGDPIGKLSDFKLRLDGPLRGKVNVALVKICYVDLAAGAGVDPDSLFGAYRRTVLDLETEHPGLVVVPVTSPLTVPDFGARGRLDALKGMLGRWLGRPDDNARRARFNARIRDSFRDRIIFDLAAIESTRPDGTLVRYGRGGLVEALAREYSSDGGHLNALGRKVAARALLRTLARVPSRPVPVGDAGAIGGPRPNS